MTTPDNHSLASAIARDHGQTLRRFVASRLRQTRDAIDDIVQEVYLRIIRRGEKGAVNNPEAYVIQVAAHTLYDLGYGAAHPAMQALTATMEEPAATDDPTEAADLQRRLERVEEALKELPPRIYASFLLYRVHGLSHEKIAALNHVHPNTVKNDIKAAASHLSQRFGRLSL